MSLLEKRFLKLGYPINLVLETAPYGFDSSKIEEIYQWCYNNHISDEVRKECEDLLHERIFLKLNDSERECIRLRYEEEMTYLNIGKTVNKSQERVRQIIAKSVRKIRYKSPIIFVLAKGISTDSETVMKYSVMIKHGILYHYDELKYFPCYNRKQWAWEFHEGKEPDISWFEKGPWREIAKNGVSAYVNRLEIRMTELVAENIKLKEKLKIPVDTSDLACVDLISIEDLDFSVRAFNVLKRGGYNFVKDLRHATKYDISKLRNCGKRSLNEILDKLDTLGITLEDGFDEDILEPKPWFKSIINNK